MHTITKKILCIALFLTSFAMHANDIMHAPTNDYVTIATPANGATVSQPISITGGSSQANMRVRLTINTTQIGSATTDRNGDWAFELNTLNNGTYTLTADLMDSNFDILATTVETFSVQNAHTISIDSPEENEVVMLTTSTVSGTTSLPSGLINISLDGTLVTTTTADSNGSWQTQYTLSTNGVQTLLAQLMVLGNPAANTTVDINAKIPVIFPSGKSQIRVIDGVVPTSGSGSGSGYTYTVSGSIVTINFIPAFSSTPSLVAVGLRSAGSSTVTLSSVSTTAAGISFSTGTQSIHFTATALA